jgi:hypothetical protein
LQKDEVRAACGHIGLAKDLDLLLTARKEHAELALYMPLDFVLGSTDKLPVRPHPDRATAPITQILIIRPVEWRTHVVLLQIHFTGGNHVADMIIIIRHPNGIDGGDPLLRIPDHSASIAETKLLQLLHHRRRCASRARPLHAVIRVPICRDYTAIEAPVPILHMGNANETMRLCLRGRCLAVDKRAHSLDIASSRDSPNTCQGKPCAIREFVGNCIEILGGDSLQQLNLQNIGGELIQPTVSHSQLAAYTERTN